MYNTDNFLQGAVLDQLESSQFITIYYNFDKDQDNDSNKDNPRDM